MERLNPQLLAVAVVLITVHLRETLSVSGSTFTRVCSEFSNPRKISISGLHQDQIVFPSTTDKYKPNEFCEWDISTKVDKAVIKLQPIMLSTQGRDIHEECHTDYIDVFDVKEGTEEFLGRMCGLKRDVMFESTGPRMIVRFISDKAYEYRGFTLVYQAVVSESRDESSLPFKVVIPIAVIVPLLFVVLSVVLFRFWRTNRLGHRVVRRHHGMPPGHSSVLGISHGAESPPRYCPDSFRFVPGQPRMSAHNRDISVNVTLPQENVRPPTPPPSYNSLGYAPAADDEVGTTELMTPPSYETVLKEKQEEGNPATDC